MALHTHMYVYTFFCQVLNQSFARSISRLAIYARHSVVVLVRTVQIVERLIRAALENVAMLLDCLVHVFDVQLLLLAAQLDRQR